MRLLLFMGFCLLLSQASLSQSKQELLAEIKTLKLEIEQLKKAKEVNLTDAHAKASYGLGVLMAGNLKSQGADSLNLEALTKGLRDVLTNQTLKMSEQESMMIVQQYMQQANARKIEKQREEGKAFLETNKKKEGIIETSSGLQYKVITAGTGKSPGPNDRVTVHYTGKLIDGTVFDSSVQRGEPIAFGVTEVIRGWTEALQLMREGDKWLLYIPYNLGYGERSAPGGKIPPYSTLIFEVELIKVN